MFELFTSGGLLMLPILLCSVIALAIIVERSLSYRRPKITPDNVLPTMLHNLQNGTIDKKYLKRISHESPLGKILAKGLSSLNEGQEMLLLRMAEQGRHCIHELEKYLNTLGTIAAIAPLIGLLGTVTGMIEVFSAITQAGTPDPELLASGISQALLTTAFGLSVAIPSMMFHRHFHRKIDEFAVVFEQEAAKLCEHLKDIPSRSVPAGQNHANQRVA